MTPPEPHISLWQAHLLAGFFASSYVGCLYLFQNARLTYSSLHTATPGGARIRRRDDADVIRARLAAVSASTVASCGVLCLAVWYLTPESPHVGMDS